MKRFITALALGGLLLLLGCEEQTVLSASGSNSSVRIELNGLAAPGDSAWYEAWISFDERIDGEDVAQFVSLGLLNREGAMYSLQTDIATGYLQKSKEVIVTVELDDVPGMRFTSGGDTLFTPSRFSIIGSTIAFNESQFSVGSKQLLNFDFSQTAGSFIVGTATDNALSSTPAGIWFTHLDTSVVLDSLGNISAIDTSYGQALNLPALERWTYEALVIKGSDTLSCGAFLDPVLPDNAFTYSGSGRSAITTFPGEDFINNAPAGLAFPWDVAGAKVIVTLTPDVPARANLPFKITVLQATVPDNPALLQNYQLESPVENFPAGEMLFTIKIYE